MSEVKLSLEKYRGKWCARGHDAFGVPIRRKSLDLNDTEPKDKAGVELGLLKAKIIANGGHALVQGKSLVCDALFELYYKRGVSKGEVGKVKIVGDYWGRIPVSSVDEAAVLDWELTMVEGGLGPATIKRYNNVLKAVLSYGCKKKKLPAPKLPVIGTDSPPRTITISNERRDKIFDCMDDYARRFFIVLAFIGARPKELINVLWRDVDLYNKRITLRCYKGKGGIVRSRTIPYSLEVEQVLNELRSLSQCDRNEHVFKESEGKAWADFKDSTKAVGLRLKNATHKAGFEFGVEAGVFSYALRHTFGTNAGNNGKTNALLLSAYIGHKKVQTTIDNYFHGGVGDAEVLVQGLG